MSGPAHKTVEEILLEMGVVDEERLREARQVSRARRVEVGEILVQLGHLREEDLARARARRARLPFVDLSKGRVPQAVLDAFPKALAERYGLLPVARRGQTLVLALEDPARAAIADDVRFVLKQDIALAVAAPRPLRDALRRHYGIEPAGARQAEPPARRAAAATRGEGAKGTKGAGAAADDEAPIIRLVQHLFDRAVAMRASDIHIEPMHDRVVTRYRVDGVLREAPAQPKEIQGALLSRLKLMAGMDIAEKRKPQDGRILLHVGGRDLDVRASALPATGGETMVFRLLDREQGLKSLESLGLDPRERERFARVLRRPHGLVLVTGPTGSGKTTTLYAALQELNRPNVKILTVEDPVEYQIPGLNQSQIKPAIGLTFARVLRSMLRQAPNIILVGEIRDRETAETAIQAALTGHLVFSTLHTNDASSAIPRLHDMGVPSFLTASALLAVLAQRLVRVVCPKCAVDELPVAREVRAIGLDAARVGDRSFKRAKGCRDCGGSGYRGRVGIFELLEVDETLREMAYRRESLLRIREQARANGMATLEEDAARKVLAGTTTVEELLRVTRAGAGL